MEKTTGEADIQENRLKELSPDLLNTLLKDHTTSKEGKQCNIFWATSDYEQLGKGYEYGSRKENSVIYSGLLPIMNSSAKVMNTGHRFSQS